MTPQRLRLALFADRLNRRWVIRDLEGQFWSLPFSGASWAQRETFEPSENECLEPVPAHYLVVLGLKSNTDC